MSAARDHDPLHDPDKVVELRGIDILNSHRPATDAYVVAVATGLIPEPCPPPVRYVDSHGRHRKPSRRDWRVIGARTYAAVVATACAALIAVSTVIVVKATDLSVTGWLGYVVFIAVLAPFMTAGLRSLATLHRCCDSGYVEGGDR